jgi:hypothetical protein
MLDIVKLTEELRSKLQAETDELINDRLTTRDLLKSRSRELAERRDAELTRIDQWARQQRKVMEEIFTALIEETEADARSNDDSLQRLIGENHVPEAAIASLPFSRRAADARSPAAQA